MRRLKPLKINIQNLWDSSDDDDVDDSGNIRSDTPLLTTTRHQTNMTLQTPVVPHNNVSRLSVLPAFPSLHKNGVVTYHGREQLLLANVPRDRLTGEQRRRRERNYFAPPFTLADQRKENNMIPSVFIKMYHQLFNDLAHRLRVDNAILDYNYDRLIKCIDIMTNERIQYRFHTFPFASNEQLPLSEYAIALEFYLQIDVDLFYMKTCNFRGAKPPLYNNRGLFCIDEPQARYGITRCEKNHCLFCFPSADILARARPRNKPVVQFFHAQKHTFVNGYQAILNCPAWCETKNIIYALTCPCRQFDYVGYTSMTLGQRLFYHRKHGNRIMREFLLGTANVARIDETLKSHEESTKNGMLLYKHSARCPVAMQMFLDCNPIFWHFVPMTKAEAEKDNNHFDQLQLSVPADQTSSMTQNDHLRSDLEIDQLRVSLPPLPSNNYTFSTHQRAKQFQIFQQKQNYLWPNNDLDLYNATIVAVLPEDSSGPLQRTIEALFITHTETKLNTIGHLDGTFVNNNPRGITQDQIINDRGDWCCNLLCRPST